MVYYILSDCIHKFLVLKGEFLAQDPNSTHWCEWVYKNFCIKEVSSDSAELAEFKGKQTSAKELSEQIRESFVNKYGDAIDIYEKTIEFHIRAINKLNSVESSIGLNDYKQRQIRAYNNKVNHGFNITDFQKEARFILKELSELMDAIEHNDVENIMEELGDIVIFCYGIAEMAHRDLDEQIFKKMLINEQRKYHRDEYGDFIKEQS